MYSPDCPVWISHHRGTEHSAQVVLVFPEQVHSHAGCPSWILHFSYLRIQAISPNIALLIAAPSVVVRGWWIMIFSSLGPLTSVPSPQALSAGNRSTRFFHRTPLTSTTRINCTCRNLILYSGHCRLLSTPLVATEAGLN